jgi:Dolichyl-phosphate-mannose-protein mannosyltransferase
LGERVSQAVVPIVEPAPVVTPPGTLPTTAFSRLLTGGLVVLGFGVRILPLVQGRELLIRQPTEDGYLMLAVARNMALGLGMSTAAGTMPTNGVQPLATGIDAIAFLLAGGDKTAGVALVMALSVLIAGLSLLAVYRLGCAIFKGSRGGNEIAALAAAAWFASPIVVEHSMNALETGLYFLTTAVAMRYFVVHAADPDRDLPWSRCGVLGLLLGLAFWSRNDAIFLACAIALARVGLSLGRPASVMVRRVGELAISAGVMAVVAAPWMISNAIRFGSVVPISGKAEAADRIGANLDILPAKLAEFLTVVGAIPNPIEPHASVRLVCSVLVLVAVGVAFAVFRRGSKTIRAGVLLGLVHAFLFATYYGAFFGAGHFLSRYTAPISILTAFLTVGVVMTLMRVPAVRFAFPAVLLVLALALDARSYRNRHEHMHFQVVSWVESNVADDEWVGAIQSGTVGFFHDRTINLDGKTNPAALKAHFANRMREYILASPIKYIADWSGIAGWHTWLEPNFQVVVDDPVANLGVLKRLR